MTRVRLAVGMNVAGAAHQRGDVVDVEREVAEYLVAGGRAELVRAQEPERAVEPGPENTARQARGRRRGPGSKPEQH